MISEDIDLYTLEPMKYQSLPASATPEQIIDKVNTFINTHDYIYSLKTDGNYARMLWQDNNLVLQSRGISKKTGEYGRLEGKVLFSESMESAFYDTTMLIGEVYLDGGVDKDVGSILRCLDDKALARQKGDKVLKYRIFDCFYYNGISLLNSPITERIKYLSKAAEAINHPLVSYVKYYEAKPETFWDKLDTILSSGGEGVVLYHKDMRPYAGRTPASMTLKVKQMLSHDIDCFIINTEPAKMEYTGKDPANWGYWKNTKTEELYPEGANHYAEYVGGGTVIPVTKSYYYGLPGAIQCAVWDENDKLYPICKCSNLTDELSYDLKDNFMEKYYMRPCKIQGMMISHNQNDDTISIRHPKLIGIRNDIDITDCTLSKIIGE